MKIGEVYFSKSQNCKVTIDDAKLQPKPQTSPDTMPCLWFIGEELHRDFLAIEDLIPIYK